MTLTIIYITIGSFSLIQNLTLFQYQEEPSPEETMLALVVLLTVSFLWIVALPLALIHNFQENKLNAIAFIPVFLGLIIAMIVNSI